MGPIAGDERRAHRHRQHAAKHHKSISLHGPPLHTEHKTNMEESATEIFAIILGLYKITLSKQHVNWFVKSTPGEQRETENVD